MRRLPTALCALLTVAGLLLTGCVTVPTAGPVERHSPAQQQANPGVDIAPVPPAEGATPGLIVEGFLHAMATYQPGYAVARQFLTREAAELWRPESGVEIYAGGYPPQISATGVVLTAPLVGSLDGEGSFTPASRQYHHDFALVRDADGQWRISQPPRGLLVSQSLFSSAWVRSDVCFWDATGAWLVPDPRFVQTGPVGMLATVRAVLVGPSRVAAQAYRAPLTAGVDAAAVTLDSDGTARVELIGAVDGLDAAARRLLAAELVWSLTSLEGVTGLRVTGNGTPWDLGGGGGAVTTDDFHEGAPVPGSAGEGVYLIRDGVLERANWIDPGASPQAVGGTLNRAGAVGVRPDGQAVGVVTDGGTRLRSVGVRDGATRVELHRLELRRRPLDPAGRVVGGARPDPGRPPARRQGGPRVHRGRRRAARRPAPRLRARAGRRPGGGGDREPGPLQPGGRGDRPHGRRRPLRRLARADPGRVGAQRAAGVGCRLVRAGHPGGAARGDPDRACGQRGQRRGGIGRHRTQRHHGTDPTRRGVLGTRGAARP